MLLWTPTLPTLNQAELHIVEVIERTVQLGPRPDPAITDTLSLLADESRRQGGAPIRPSAILEHLYRGT